LEDLKSGKHPNIETVGILAEDYEEKSIYSEDEGIDDYKSGGYHPVHVGEVLNGRYVIL
jgi:serine/threonine-protein kinase SRPK3